MGGDELRAALPVEMRSFVVLVGAGNRCLERGTDFRIEDPEHVAFRAFRKHPEPRVSATRDAARYRGSGPPVLGSHGRRQRLRRSGLCRDRFALVGNCDTTTLAWYIDFRGMEQAMFDLLEEPDLVHAVMEKGVEYAIERGKFCIDRGLRVLRLNDSVANMSVISPASWREFTLPHMGTVCAELHAYEPPARVYCHICGDVMPIVEDLIATGLDVIGPLDPLGGFTVAEARACSSDHITGYVGQYGSRWCWLVITILLLGYGALLGQFRFFWEREKRIGRRLWRLISVGTRTRGIGS